MRKIIILLLGTSLFCACQKNTSVDEVFDAYTVRFMDSYWYLHPDKATLVGYHAFDTLLQIPGLEYRRKQLGFVNRHLDSLKLYKLSELNDANKTDYKMLENELLKTRFSLGEWKEFCWNPALYNLCGLFSYMLEERYDSLDHRLQAIGARLTEVPDYYKAAQLEISNPTAEHTDLAIKQHLNSAAVFSLDLMDSLKRSNLPNLEKELIRRRAKAAFDAVSGYVKFLEQLKPANPRSFRIGKVLYDKRFDFEVTSAYKTDELYALAKKRKEEVRLEMARLAIGLWPIYFGIHTRVPKNEQEMIGKVIEAISHKHATPEDYMRVIREEIPDLEAFIKARDLMYIDPSRPLVVRRTPSYMTGVASASTSGPGPYDKHGVTYYNIGSLDGMPKERAESYLREYNEYVLRLLNIHQTIPGHYAQLSYSNMNPAIVKTIFGNGAMKEGWAAYSELMMLEAGYHNSPEMWLMYYKWHLRSVYNVLLDYNVHVLGMDKQSAVDMLVNEAFQERAEAEGKWHRATISQVELASYFAGFTDVYELRESLRKKRGEAFDLREFHEQFLSYGSAPVKYIAELIGNR